MDQFQIDSAPGAGTTVVLTKLMPKRAPLILEADLARIAGALARERPQDPSTNCNTRTRSCSEHWKRYAPARRS